MPSTINIPDGVDVDKTAMALEIEYCASAARLRRHGVTLTSYVETGLRDFGLLPGIPIAPDHDRSQLAAHYPKIAERLERMQREIGEVAR